MLYIYLIPDRTVKRTVQHLWHNHTWMLRTHFAILFFAVALSPARASADEAGSTMGAHPGIVWLPSATPMAANVLRICLVGTYFQESDFGGTGGRLTGVQSWAAVGYTVSPRVSVAASYAFSSHRGTLDPPEIQAFGDVDVSALVSVWSGTELGALEVTGAAVHGGVRSLAGGYLPSASPYVDAIASGRIAGLDLVASAGFLGDRSPGVFDDPVVLDASQRAAYGVAEGSHMRWSVGASYPLLDGRIRPYLQYRGRAYFGDAAGDSPHLIGVGATSGLPWAGRTVHLSAGADIAAAGTSPEPKRPREPVVRALMKVSFVAPPVRDHEIRDTAGPTPTPIADSTPLPTPTPEVVIRGSHQGAITGVVRDEESGEPLAATVISFLGFSRNAVLTDAYGRWRQGEFSPGEVRIRAQKSGYSPAVTTVTVEADGTVRADIDLIPAKRGAKTGTLAGSVKTRSGSPLSATLVVQVGKTRRELDTDDAGRFRKDLPPGRYVVQVSAPGYVQQTKTLEVTAGELTVFNVLLSRR